MSFRQSTTPTKRRLFQLSSSSSLISGSSNGRLSSGRQSGGSFARSSSIESVFHSNDEFDDTSIVGDPKRRKLAPRFKLTGDDYQRYKPEHKDRLYARIINEFDWLENVVDYWADLFKRNETTAIICLNQLIVDLLGYQHYDLEKINNSDDYVQILNELRLKPTDLQLDGHYILRSSSAWKRSFQQILFDFFDKLVQKFNDLHLLCIGNLDAFFDFLVIFTKTDQRHMRATSTIICATISTSLAKVYSKRNELKSSKNEVQFIKDTFNRLATICTIRESDEELYYLEKICMDEYNNWFTLDINIFQKIDKFINFVIHSVSHWCPHVRTSAIKCCKAIIPIEDKKVNLRIIATIKERLERDVNPKVPIMCITFFNFYANKHFLEIPNTVNKYILDVGLLHKTYDFAKESAIYAYKCIHLTNRNENIYFLNEFLKLVSNKHLGQIFLITESFLDVASDFRNFEFLISTLFDGAIKGAAGNDLIKVIYCIIYQLVKGNCPDEYQRERYRKEPKKNIGQNNINISNAIMPIIIEFIEKYKNIDLKLQFLVKILVLFDYSEIAFLHYKLEINESMRLLLNIFNNNELDTEISTIICNYFSCIIKSPLREDCIDLIDGFIRAKVEEYNTILFTIQDNENRRSVSVLNKLDDLLSQLSNIFEHISTNRSGIVWTSIFNDWSLSTLNEKSIACQISCSRYFLQWELRRLVIRGFTVLDVHEMALLNGLINQFIAAIVALLSSTRSQHLKDTAFNSICGFCGTYTKATNDNAAYGEHAFVFAEGVDKVLVKFVLQKCFINKTDSLECRRMYLKNLFDMLLNYKYITDNYFEIFYYYLNCKEDYKCVFESVFVTNNKSIIPFIIMQTIGYFHNRLIKMTPTHRNRESLQTIITDLCKEFLHIIHKNVAYQVIDLCIKSIKNYNIAIVTYLTVFIVKLSQDQKTNLFALVNDKLENYNNTEAVVKFKGCLERFLLNKSRSNLDKTNTPSKADVVPEISQQFDEILTIEEVDSP